MLGKRNAAPVVPLLSFPRSCTPLHCTEPRVIYFGDHLTGDVQAVAQLTSWQAVAIAEELLLHR